MDISPKCDWSCEKHEIIEWNLLDIESTLIWIHSLYWISVEQSWHKFDQHGTTDILVNLWNSFHVGACNIMVRIPTEFQWNPGGWSYLCQLVYPLLLGSIVVYHWADCKGPDWIRLPTHSHWIVEPQLLLQTSNFISDGNVHHVHSFGHVPFHFLYYILTSNPCYCTKLNNWPLVHISAFLPSAIKLFTLSIPLNIRSFIFLWIINSDIRCLPQTRKRCYSKLKVYRSNFRFP